MTSDNGRPQPPGPDDPVAPDQPAAEHVPADPFADAWTADKLLATTFPDPRWAVPELIPEGLSVVAGAPKAGKSWLAMNVGLAVAAGGHALGSIPCDPGPVLYLALEDNPRRLQRRIRQLLDGQPAPAGLTLATSCKPLPAGGDHDIATWLEHHRNARLVIIDVFAKVRGAATNANAYADDYSAAGRVKRLADHYGVAFVLIHHTRKMGAEDFLEQISGTNGIAGSADTIHVLQRGRGNADGVLHTTGRDVEETDRALRLDKATGNWTLLDGPALDHTLGATRATILRYVREHPGASPKEIAAGTGLDIQLTRKTCARMAESGHLVKITEGHYAALPPDPYTADTGDPP